MRNGARRAIAILLLILIMAPAANATLVFGAVGGGNHDATHPRRGGCAPIRAIGTGDQPTGIVAGVATTVIPMRQCGGGYSAPVMGRLAVEDLSQWMVIPADHPCAAGVRVDLRFRLPIAGTLEGRVGLADFYDATGAKAFVGLTRTDAVSLGFPGNANAAPDAFPVTAGEWHHLTAKLRAGVLEVAVDGSPPIQIPADVPGRPTSIRIGGQSRSPLAVELDDIRVGPIDEPFVELFTTPWARADRDALGNVTLDTTTFTSAPASLRIESAQAASSFAFPTCLQQDIAGVNVSVRFHVAEGDFSPANQILALATRVVAGGDRGDHLTFALDDADEDGFLEFVNASGGRTPTTTRLPRGGWHHLEAYLRPHSGEIDHWSRTLFAQPVDAEIQLDGSLVGIFATNSTRAPNLVSAGEAWWSVPNPTLHPGVLRLDDFRVRVDIVSQLCQDERTVWHSNVDATTVLFEPPLADGDGRVVQLTIDSGTGPVDVTTTRSMTVPLSTEGIHDLEYALLTDRGIRVVETCRVGRDDTAPMTDVVEWASGRNGWLRSAEYRMVSTDDRSGILTESILVDGEDLRPPPGSSWVTIPHGTHHLEAWSMDAAGNEGGTIAWDVQVDRVKPHLDLAFDPPGRVDPSWAVATQHAAPLTISGVLTDADSGPGSMTFRPRPQDASVPFERTIILDQQGWYHARFWGDDVAGNDVLVDRIFLVDARMPTASFAATPAPGPSGTYPAGTVVTVTAADDASGVTKLEVRVDDGPWATSTSGGAATLSRTTAALPHGEHDVRARVTDGVGHVHESSHRIRVDGTPPVLAITSPSEVTLHTPLGAFPVVFLSSPQVALASRITYEGTASDPDSGITRVTYTYDGVTRVATGTESWSFTLSPGTGYLEDLVVTAWNGAGVPTEQRTYVTSVASPT